MGRRAVLRLAQPLSAVEYDLRPDGRKPHRFRSDSLYLHPLLPSPSARIGGKHGLTPVAVGTGVTSCPLRRSRRAAFPHRAPVEGQTRPGCLGHFDLARPIRRHAASVTCRVRRWVRGMRRHVPSLRPAAFPPHSPPPTRRPALFEASSVLCSRPTPPTFRPGFGSSPSRTDPGPPWRLRAAGGLPGSHAILGVSNLSQTPAERRSLA